MHTHLYKLTYPIYTNTSTDTYIYTHTYKQNYTLTHI
jgi:hypothetical protein